MGGEVNKAPKANWLRTPTTVYSWPLPLTKSDYPTDVWGRMGEQAVVHLGALAGGKAGDGSWEIGGDRAGKGLREWLLQEADLSC